MKKNAMANYFYEQCTGTHAGHMALVPNNPTMHGLVKAVTGSNNNTHAATKEEFAEFLTAMANDLIADQ